MTSIAELEENNGYIRAQENINFGVWLWYVTEERMTFTKNLCCIFDLDNVNPSFNLLIERIYPEDAITFLSNIERILEDSKPLWSKFRIMNTDGSMQLFSCLMEVIRSEGAVIHDIIGVCFEMPVNPL